MVEVKTANQLKDLKELLTSGGDISVAVAYVTQEGLELIENELRIGMARGRVRMMLSLDGRTTQPNALRKLLELSDKGLATKFFDIPADRHAIFHPKLYISRDGKFTNFLTGSYNLTWAALCRNKEHGLLVTCNNSEQAAQDAMEQFNLLWEHCWAKPLTPAEVDEYEDKYRSSGSALPDEELPNRRYWLFKCNPDKHKGYTFCHLLASLNRKVCWGEEISLPESIKHITEMKVGDLGLFQHSGYKRAKDNVVVGTVRIVREAYKSPDRTKTLIDIQVESEFTNSVTLTEIKNFFPELRPNPPIQPLDISRPTYTEIVKLGIGR